MKTTLYCISFVVLCISGFGQTKRQGTKTNKNKTIQNSTSATATKAQPGDTSIFSPQHTVTDRYLNGPERKSSATSAVETSKTDSSTFAAGIHAANNATKKFDTVAAAANTANTVNTINNGTTATTNRTATGSNDTTFNVNTISQGGVTTNSGAVNKSGQAQFGQTNWGNSRSTVGESQWTVPPPISASFNQEFPASNTATWTRNNADTNIYSAKYRSGAQWATTNYNAAGQRLDTRTEFPLVQPPHAVSVYMAKQPVGFQATTIYKLQVQGKADVYEIKTSSGKTVYVNNDGMEVNY